MIFPVPLAIEPPNIKKRKFTADEKKALMEAIETCGAREAACCAGISWTWKRAKVIKRERDGAFALPARRCRRRAGIEAGHSSNNDLAWLLKPPRDRMSSDR